MNTIEELTQQALNTGLYVVDTDGTIRKARSDKKNWGPRRKADMRYRKYLDNGEENPNYRHKKPDSKRDVAEFIAVDGEAEGTSSRSEETKLRMANYTTVESVARQVHIEEQKYTLLSTSTGRYVYNPDGLGTKEAFRFLIEESLAHPKATFVGYGFRYDVEMMLKDIGTAFLRELHKKSQLLWNGYRLKYVPGKWIDITDLNWADHLHAKKNPSIRIYDVLGFFQGGLVKTIKEWWPDCPDLELIEKGKSLRSSFSESDEDWVRQYNDAENRALVEVMTRLHAAMTEVGCVPRLWHGAGAYATEMLTQYGVKAHMARDKVNKKRADGSEYVEEVQAVPKWVRGAALYAFAGGRIEAIQAGNHEATAFRYDLNSAYPWALPDLPSLADGFDRWKMHDGDPRKKGVELQPYTMYAVQWNFTGKLADLSFCPFFYRLGGRIFYPHTGMNWVWGPEVLAAERCGLGKGFKILHWIDYDPPTQERPFAWVVDAAAKRLEYKDAGNPAHLPLKLGLNSLYGKTAQTRGADYDENGVLRRVPPFYQPEWAGYITSKTRAAVFEKAMQAPDHILGFMTDGIFSTQKLSVDRGRGLGQWEVERLDWVTQVQSGVYWYASTDKKGVQTITAHHRGFDKGSISREKVLTAYREGRPIVECTMKRFVGLGQSLHHASILGTEGAVPDENEARFRGWWRTWRTAPRLLAIAFQTGKRGMLTQDELRSCAHRTVSTNPRYIPINKDEMSEPTTTDWKDWDALMADPGEDYDGTAMRFILDEYGGD